MAKHIPFIQRVAGDVVTSDDWNRLQELIREEVRQHRHEGETGDTNRLGALGTRLDNASLAEGAVDERALATGAVTARALQDESVTDRAVAVDAAIPERDNLQFDVDGGHDHDGAGSAPLAPGSVGTAQLAEDAVTFDKLAPALLDEIADMELLLSIPQALYVGSAPGTQGGQDSFVDIVGHGFGTTEGVVRLLKTTAAEPGEYTDAGAMTIDEWTDNKIRVLLPEDPTGLFQVEIDGLALNPLEFDESLLVTSSVPEGFTLNTPIDTQIQVTFSTELLVDSTTAMAGGSAQLMVRYPGQGAPAVLEQEVTTEPPYADLPIEIFYGDDAERLDALLTVSVDRKTVTLTPASTQLPFDTPFLIKVYGSDDQDVKPVLLAANDGEPVDTPTAEISFTTQQKPPPVPVQIRILRVEGKGGVQVSPENVISLGNHDAVPLEILTHATALPSESLEVVLTDGKADVTARIPAIGAGQAAYVTLDGHGLEDGPVQVRVRAHNPTNHSDWRHVEGTDPRTGDTVDWVPKDTRPPFLRVHPVRSPTRFDTQAIEVDVEPGSTVTFTGGARPVSVVDTKFEGTITADVPLNPNTANHLTAQAVDPAGNQGARITADQAGTALRIVHDDTVPQLKVDPVKTPTRVRTLVLTGRSNEKVTVVATAGGEIATGTADINKPFKIPFTLAPNRANDIRIVATDTAGNTSPPVNLRVVHDDTPPFLRLVNKGYHRFLDPSSSTPHIVVRRTRTAIGGYTEPGATVTLTGHGHRVSTRAGGDGAFTIGIPFRLTPSNIHNRAETRTWYFDLDAVDLSGNRTNQRKQVAVSLEYRIPDSVGQIRWWVGYWWWGWWTWWLSGWRGRYWFYDSGNNHIVWYYQIVYIPSHHHYHWYFFDFGAWYRNL